MNYDTLQVPHIEGFESPKKLQNTNTDHTPSTLPFSFQNQKFSTPPSTPNKPTSSRGSDRALRKPNEETALQCPQMIKK